MYMPPYTTDTQKKAEIMFTPLPLKLNCGFARVGIRELTSKQNGQCISLQERKSKFRTCFSNLQIPDDFFSGDPKRFDKQCDKILEMFSKKWNTPVRESYEKTFSITNWGKLSTEKQKQHTLSCCNQCSKDYSQLQRAFPGKPVHNHLDSECSVSLSLPHIITNEKKEAQTVLTDLDNLWEQRHGHNLTRQLPKLAPHLHLTTKTTKIEKKRKDRNLKRKISKCISEQLGESATITVLAEAESMSAYSRKRLAMSFEKPETPSKRPKLHSPSLAKQTWDHEEAKNALKSHPQHIKINWSETACTLNIPGGNAGQILKEFAIKQGFNVNQLENRSTDSLPRLRMKKRNYLEEKFLHLHYQLRKQLKRKKES